ncbi:MAG: hypothetical protein NC339_00240 [Muribaculaceae bacterium]|nr:hypothetical protein [Muribaculaceae bacterium]
MSDEIIGKIHTCYPTLSIMWLMFGEGNMTSDTPTTIESTYDNANVNANNNTVRPESGDQIGVVNANKPIVSEFAFTNEDHSNREDQNPASANTGRTFAFATENTISNHEEETYTLKAENGKKVIGIVIYYDDNTFESYLPDPDHRLPFIR